MKLIRPATSSSRQGYALAVTLVLLAVAALALVATTRAAVHRAVVAAQQQRELQTRWGMITLGHALEGQAEILLSQAEKQNDPGVVLKSSLQIGDRRFDVLISDEQAKFNVNALAEGHQRELPSIIRDLLGSNPLSQRILLQPVLLGEKQQFPGLGHLFLHPSADELLADQEGSCAVDALTCWGNGKLNLKRANPEVIRAFFEPVLGAGAVGRLQVVCRQDTIPSLAQLADELHLTDKQKQWFGQHATLSSQCHSIWIRCGSQARLIVDEGPEQKWLMEW